jgi:cell division protein YceG involved in septum cleavage
MQKAPLVTRIFSYLIFLCIAAMLGGMSFLLYTKNVVYMQSLETRSSSDIQPFPISVNPLTQTIDEDVTFDIFYETTFAREDTTSNRLLSKITAVLSNKNWYQNLASPVSRIVVIWPGERKEEVTEHIGDILRWDTEQRNEFQNLIDTQAPTLSDGKYFPGQYVTHRSATPLDMASLIATEFSNEITQRYPQSVENIVPLEDALIIASLLEREASDFQNKREVAGVIWNRLFIDMPLQLDATLQYAKASQGQWWPVPKPADKFVDSPYNSYKNKGLPPSPIANPSAEAILAALNPIQTDCLFYFHGPDSEYYCSIDYDEHVTQLKNVYGQGN